ncbi:MAG: hypothetical protein ABIJ56_20735 [Pseudomonadota bacterium]
MRARLARGPGWQLHAPRHSLTQFVDRDENIMHGRDHMPDEEVWLDPDDPADGIDTMVEAALDRIAGEIE